MQKIIIEQTPKMPGILFDPDEGKLEIIGNSIPEDANSFYRPIAEAINEYFKSPKPLTKIKFDLEYFNSSSSKWFMNILKLVKTNLKTGVSVEIDWYYDENDEDMGDVISDYKAILQLPINIKKK
jgi:hypothetical protein